MSLRKNILLATHIKPAFHGQAMMANQLSEVSADWDDVNIHTLNTSYTEKRSKLKGFSLGKVLRLVKYALEARKLIKAHEISHVILCPAFFKGPFLKDAAFAWFIKFSSNVQLIGWVHMDPARLDYENKSAILQKFIQSRLSKFDYWVACADSLIARWPIWLKEDRSVYAIANGIVDVPLEIRDRSKDELCNVVFLSAIDDEKGWRELFRSAEDICERSEAYAFHFYGGVGANVTEKQVEETFSSTKYSSRIQWHGAVYGEKKVNALNQATVFVFPSYTEQFPLTVLEAMAYGIPIISTNVGAVSDALPDEQLIALKNEEAITEALWKLFEDKEEIKKQSLHNRERYVQVFSEHAFASNWYKFLQKITS